MIFMPPMPPVPIRISGLPAEISTLDRCVVMGVVNVTPDSFSDGGEYLDAQQAISRGIELCDQGADLVDVGGESTRPGAKRVRAEIEVERVQPVVAGLVAAGVAVSIDTMRGSVAAAAVAAGACLVNDVSGGLADEDMFPTIAGLDVPMVIMHWRAHSEAMDTFTEYDDVVAEVVAHLVERRDAAVAAGIAAERIILDPGLGFAKLPEHNWALLRSLTRVQALGQPVLIAASRKRFLGAALTGDQQHPRPVDQRGAATDAISALAAWHGAWGVRVHEVPGTLDAVRMAHRWQLGGQG